MRTWVSLSALVVYLLVGQTAGGESVPDLYQPVESRTNLLLESTPGRAIVERDGGSRQTLSVRPGEILTTVAETSDGWAAAGIRPLDEGTDLVVIRRSANGTERLSPPGPQRHDLRLRPILLTDRRDLGGIAWLEGANLTSLSVRAATRSAEGWDETTVVSPTAKGSQTGLVGVEISGGEWLLVWAAFDGQDDDLFWSESRDSNRWSPPRRIAGDNSVPDIMPTLVATDSGALVAWSRMVDGQYQLLLSRFDGQSWSEALALGTAGSLDPGFVLRGNRIHLVFNHAWPAGWTIAEVTPRGRLQRFAVLGGDTGSRPVLSASSGDTVELRWPDRARKAAKWEPVP